VAILDVSPGKDSSLAAAARVCLGDALVASGDAAAAVTVLEQAVSAAAASAARPEEQGGARFALARALRAAGRDPARAAELARAAREDFVRAGAVGAPEIARVDSFLAAP
jgi:hypothetical protein